jgi:hypothetical protein
MTVTKEIGKKYAGKMKVTEFYLIAYLLQGAESFLRI